jgi:hypothetical protein
MSRFALLHFGMSRFALLRFGLAAMAAVLVLAASPVEAGDNYGKFFWSDPDPEPPIQPLPPREVGLVLRREGARMIGAPRLRGNAIVAIGRDPSGAQRRFTLDAETGEVLTITLVRPAPQSQPPRIYGGAAPERPLGPPIHPAGPLDADQLSSPPPPMPPEQVVPPPPPRVEPPPPPMADAPELEIPAVPAPASPDAALSPIKPLRPAPGAPRVEKLPQ